MGLLRRYPAGDRMGIWLAIGAPWTITDRGLRETRAFADRTGTPLVMHILENDVDNVLCRERNGMNIVPYLAETGFLGPDLLAIHCVAVDERDIELFAEYGVKVSYNPVSNMYLGSGIPPMMRMAAAGLTISIGVDGAGSNNSQDMIESLKFAALLQKVAARDASVVDAQTILDWATLGGARVLGLEHEIGSLEAGKKADLFVLAARAQDRPGSRPGGIAGLLGRRGGRDDDDRGRQGADAGRRHPGRRRAGRVRPVPGRRVAPGGPVWVEPPRDEDVAAVREWASTE